MYGSYHRLRWRRMVARLKMARGFVRRSPGRYANQAMFYAAGRGMAETRAYLRSSPAITSWLYDTGSVRCPCHRITTAARPPEVLFGQWTGAADPAVARPQQLLALRCLEAHH